MRTWLWLSRQMLTMAWRIDPLRSGACIVLVVLLAGVNAAIALSGRWLVDAAGQGTLAGTLWAVALGTVLFGFSATGFALYSNLRVDVSNHVASHLSSEVAATASAIPGIAHLERADYLDRIGLVRNGAWAMAGAGWSAAETGASAVSLGLSLWLLGSVHPALMLLTPLAVLLFLAAHRGRILIQRTSETTAELERTETELHHLFINAESAKELRTSGSGEAVSDEADRMWVQALRCRAGAMVKASALQLIGWSIYVAGIAAALLLLVSLVVDNRATVGDIVLVVALVGQLRDQTGQTITGITQLGMAGHAIGHYQWLMEHARRERPTGGRRPPGRLREGITLRNVGFHYPATDREVLTGIDLRLPAGSTVAVVGVNGAGKSTLVKLLTGMYEPTTGIIDVDGTPMGELDTVAWRSRMAGIFQDFQKFQLVVRESIGVGDLPRIDQPAEVERAVTGAGARSIVAGLPDGLDTQLGRIFNGVQLSHGQWQRLALARGHMRDTPLLVVLDEPTAALDPHAEDEVYQRFLAQVRATCGDGTIAVLVSHRFSTVRMADLIVVLADGRIVETGSHDELLAANGSYAEHYLTQARGYIT
ncbi:ABC transporter ATP-binding protein [Streptomyces sp. SBT349]|uniref:ABC transporter ATP-binding protein n=1 Tax=Streptomyces sp. SBT349 TaxID=1580539 RepID=UPI0007C74268|nr:ABC transporter ATP-binding protein [Streptomyces sp. SBT349]